MKELTRKITILKAQIGEAREELFSPENKKIFCNRIQLLCEQIVRGRESPNRCCERFSIPFSLFENKEGAACCILKGEYPASEVTWETEEDYIKVSVEAIFNYETDSTYTFSFPADEIEFQSYLKSVTNLANGREAQLDEELLEEQGKTEQEERELLKVLQAKYNKG